MAGGQPKAPFWLAVWAVIFGLVALAAWRAGMFGNVGPRPGAGGAQVAAGGAGPGGNGAGGNDGGGAGGGVPPAGEGAVDSLGPRSAKRGRLAQAGDCSDEEEELRGAAAAAAGGGIC